MTKKVFNTEAITNELEGASLFFSKQAPQKEVHEATNTQVTPPLNVELKKDIKEKLQPEIEKKDTKRDTTIPRHHDTMPPRYHDAIIELVRRGVKDFGKEAATHRFTLPEKKAIADILYTYKSRGVRTSENEITRIAVNFLIEDFKENGESSVLDAVLRALNG